MIRQLILLHTCYLKRFSIDLVYKTIKFTIVCQDQSEMQRDITVYPPLGIVKLNMTYDAANDYLRLPPYYEKEVKGHISDTWGSLLKFKNITQFSLWRNVVSYFLIQLQ